MEIKQVIGPISPVYDDALALRQQVFIDEQSFDAEIEVDEYDAKALHVVGYQQGETVAVARMVFKDDGFGKVGRFAVAKAYRQHGFGKQLMHYLVAYAKQQQMLGLTLSAQWHARAFYAELGFVEQGDKYLEEGAEHIRMDYHFAKRS